MAQLHEYKAKQILAEQGIEIPRGEAAFDSQKAKEIAERIGGEVVVKAQIHSTSRAAAGGIKFAKSPDEAEKTTSEMLGKEIANNLCEAVLIDEKAEIEREFYLGFIVDTTLKRPTLLFSDSGGSGIEERADSMKKLVCSIRNEPTIEEIKAICGDERIAEILQKLYRVAKKTDARTAEINPLALLKDGRLVALDCRISVDDYADFRQKDLGIEIARELGHTPTKLEKIAWEIEKDDFRGTFFFVEILEDKSKIENQKSKIGFHGAGGGGSMASLDAAQRNGLSPACYVDTSGNPPASKVYRAARIILSIPNIRGYFLSGSGVASQEQFGLARAVLKAFLEVKPNIPAVLRLGGNGEDIAKELVERYAKFLPAPIEAYRKKDTADFCASRLFELISNAKTQRGKDAKGEIQSETEIKDQKSKVKNHCQFKTKTGTISFDYSQLDSDSAEKIVTSCPQKILKLDENNKPILAIEQAEAERGKCSECLACEFASLDLGLNAVKIDFPIEGLNPKSKI
ncbi:MAG: acetate--CoA ligase family protein [Pyrinomonadaceae bacterium]|nr:acetate--CoA ligase family protein [Pyrinomonadaceae bacterium]